MSTTMHLALTGTVLFAPMLRYTYLPVYDRLGLQNILIMAIRRSHVFSRCAVPLCPAAVATGPVNLGEDGRFVK